MVEKKFKEWVEKSEKFYTNKDSAEFNYHQLLASLPGPLTGHIKKCKKCEDESKAFIHNIQVETWISTKKLIDHSGLLHAK